MFYKQCCLQYFMNDQLILEMKQFQMFPAEDACEENVSPWPQLWKLDCGEVDTPGCKRARNLGVTKLTSRLWGFLFEAFCATNRHQRGFPSPMNTFHYTECNIFLFNHEWMELILNGPNDVRHDSFEILIVTFKLTLSMRTWRRHSCILPNTVMWKFKFHLLCIDLFPPCLIKQYKKPC